jgi:NADH-quinone oxidoreductase subunit N
VGGALAFDHFALFATITICVSVALVSLVINDYLTREGEDGPEVYGLMLTAAIGGVVMVSANDLLVLFLGLETLSLSFYLLTASSRSRTQSGEAGLKYFILGGFASAFFLYGVALLFGASGTTNLQSMATVFAGEVAIPSKSRSFHSMFGHPTCIRVRQHQLLRSWVRSARLQHSRRSFACS